MNIEEQILSFLSKHPYTEKELMALVSNDISLVLKKLVDKGLIIFYKRQYMLPNKINAIKGRIVSIKEHFAFASIGDEEDVFIDENDLHGAFLDDIVFLKKIPSNMRKDRYEVISIIKRARENVVGEIRVRKGMFYLDVDNISFKNYEFIIKESDFALLPHSFVLARILSVKDNYALVKPLEILGNKLDPNIDIERIILSHDAPIKFPSEVLKEVKKIPSSVKEDEIVNRTSFLDHVIVTIDGESAKDFDDAVEVSKDENCYHVGVHIADVTYYVKANSPLDKEAERRSTSLYCVDRVVPMLPFELSDGICSLNPHVLRFVQSVLFDIDFNGNILSYSLHKGVMKSSARLTYTYVNNVLKNHEIDSSLPQEVNDMIPLLYEVSTLIRKKRDAQGALDIESTELEFVLDDDGSVSDVKKRVQDVGEKLIEDLMIQANEIVTLIAHDHNMPFFYRIHESPKIKRISEFMTLSKAFSYPCSFSPFSVTPLELKNHMNNIKDKDVKEVLSSYLLRSLAKARYSDVNKGHFGLALENYTHFTSPIRRYPDLIVHRLFDYYLFNIGNKNDINELVESLVYHGENTSIREKRAQTIEREVDDLYAAKYMSKFIGNTFTGLITSIFSYGMFVELENGIDGFVSFENLSEEFVYYESVFTAISNKGTRLKLGQKIDVILESCSEEKRQITFSLPLCKKKNNMKEKRKDSKKNGRKHKINRKQ